MSLMTKGPLSERPCTETEAEVGKEGNANLAT